MQTKIWGMSYGLIGDLIGGLPMLTYYEKKYPGSYKYFGIEKRCAFTAPLFLNHPLIDRIKISDNWAGWGPSDYKLIESCDVKATYDNFKHDRADWYNYTDFVEETAILAGIQDIRDVLTEEEMKPRLYQWFDVGVDNKDSHTYSKDNNNNLSSFEKSVAIWPFGQGEPNSGRNPNPIWWNNLIEKLIKNNYRVYQYGRDKEPKLSDSTGYQKMTNMPFFEQIKACLASDIVIGVNTGPMWVVGAYSKPAIHLVTNYLPNHFQRFHSLTPINDNSINLFAESNGGVGCNGIPFEQVVRAVIYKTRD
jgi:hypothetical protein